MFHHYEQIKLFFVGWGVHVDELKAKLGFIVKMTQDLYLSDGLNTVILIFWDIFNEFDSDCSPSSLASGQNYFTVRTLANYIFELVELFNNIVLLPELWLLGARCLGESLGTALNGVHLEFEGTFSGWVIFYIHENNNKLNYN